MEPPKNSPQTTNSKMLRTEQALLTISVSTQVQLVKPLLYSSSDLGMILTASTVYMEYVHSPPDSVGFQQVLQFLPTAQILMSW